MMTLRDLLCRFSSIPCLVLPWLGMHALDDYLQVYPLSL